MKRRVVIVLSMLAASASAVAIAAGPGEADLDPPVLWESPTCAHDKLGSVTVEVGTRVNESTEDERVPVARVAPAFAKLARAARAEGGNAVVLRSHQGVYFTRNGRQSRAPVYIKLRGAVVRLADDDETCALVMARVDELEQRMRNGRPDKVTAHQAYSGE